MCAEKLVYDRLYRQYVDSLDLAMTKAGSLMGVDKRRKHDVCSELLHLEILGKRCFENELPLCFYSWALARIQEIHRKCLCY